MQPKAKYTLAYRTEPPVGTVGHTHSIERLGWSVRPRLIPAEYPTCPNHGLVGTEVAWQIPIHAATSGHHFNLVLTSQAGG